MIENWIEFHENCYGHLRKEPISYSIYLIHYITINSTKFTLTDSLSDNQCLIGDV